MSLRTVFRSLALLLVLFGLNVSAIVFCMWLLGKLILKLVKLLWPLVAALSDFAQVPVPDPIEEEQREIQPGPVAPRPLLEDVEEMRSHQSLRRRNNSEPARGNEK